MSRTIKLKDIEHYDLGGENKIPDWIEEDGTNTRVEEVVLKKWKLEEILEKYSPPNPPFNPRISDYDLPRAGFEDVGSIDLRILFGDYSAKDQNHGGGFDLENLIKGRLAKYGVGTDMVFIRVGRFPIEEINDIYNCMDLMINCTDGEGFGLTPFEVGLTETMTILPNYTSFKGIITKF